MYALIFETAYITQVLFGGSYEECKNFRIENPEICGDDVFIQEMDENYTELLAV